MKRQHPENPDLFWCPKCEAFTNKQPNGTCVPCKKEYMTRYRKENKDAIAKYHRSLFAHICKECKTKFSSANKAQDTCSRKCSQKRRMKTTPKQQRTCPICGEIRDVCTIGFYKNLAPDTRCERCQARIRSKKYLPEDPESQKRRNRTKIELLTDGYVATYLRCLQVPITPETIDLRRQQILMKRTLKKLKQWRKENDPTYTPISRKQHPDAPPDENY